jgi:hypothetical protein
MTGQHHQLADVESVTRARGLKFELVGKPPMMAMTLNGAGHSFSLAWRPVRLGSARSALAKQSRTVGSAWEVWGIIGLDRDPSTERVSINGYELSSCVRQRQENSPCWALLEGQ